MVMCTSPWLYGRLERVLCIEVTLFSFFSSVNIVRGLQMVRGGPNSQQQLHQGQQGHHMQQPLPVAQLQHPGPAGPMVNQHPSLSQHPPGTTVGDALRKDVLQQRSQLQQQQHLNNNHHQPQQLQQGVGDVVKLQSGLLDR